MSVQDIPTLIAPPAYKKKDFVSNQTVRWCPGCGDYAILNAVQKCFADLGIPKEQFVVISGIGCSSRFPYYMDTYGFHTIHGRAPAIATGLKVSRPELSVWVATGDGDALSIGGNHLLHAMRRNVDIKVLLFNNRIYGLTKGQYSPTSEVGKKTKTTPYGSIDRPIHPISVALAAEATFVARGVDVIGANLREILTKAANHKGSAFIEILQNCVIFNDGTFHDVTDRATRDERTLTLVDGQPLGFGKNRNKGIRLNGLKPEVVTLGENGITEADLLRHDETAKDPVLAYLLSQLGPPEFPTPIGIFRRIETESYDAAVHRQISDARKASPPLTLDDLFHSGDAWEVKDSDATKNRATIEKGKP